MVEDPDGGGLEAILASVGDHLVVGSNADPSAFHVEPPAWNRKPRRLLAAAAIALVLGGAILLVAPARTAVARWLGIGSTRIETVPDDPLAGEDLPSVIAGIAPITASEAERILGQPAFHTTATPLGTPDALYAMPEGGVLAEWTDSSSTLWIQTGPADTDALFTKLVGASENVETIDDLGDEALFIAGDHVLDTPNRRVAAGAVVLWTHEGIQYRLESDLPQTEMIDIARAIT